MNWVLIGDVKNRLNMQSQYLSRYLTGVGGYSTVSEGIRWANPQPGNYHAIRIHPDDVDEFVRRVADRILDTSGDVE